MSTGPRITFEGMEQPARTTCIANIIISFSFAVDFGESTANVVEFSVQII